VPKPLDLACVFPDELKWNKSAPIHDVRIGTEGETIRIGENLWQFLCRLRQPLRHTYFWADALCIDQSNVKERSSQVGGMGLTYQMARIVAIWLGEDDESTKLAFTLGNKTEDGQESAACLGRSFSDILRDEPQKGPLDGMLSAHVSAICRLGERHYWTRIWITQVRQGTSSRGIIDSQYLHHSRRSCSHNP
jgi:hypothetical protein